MIAKSIIHSTMSRLTREEVGKWVNNAMAEMQVDCELVRRVVEDRV
jgi:hypothetical protein